MSLPAPPRLRLRGSRSMRERRSLRGSPTYLRVRGLENAARGLTQGSRNRLGERPAATSSGLSRGRSPNRLRRVSKKSGMLLPTRPSEVDKQRRAY
jgi:hypothetical protein